MSVDITTEALRPGLFLDGWAALARTSPSGVFATPEWHAAVQKAYSSRGDAAVVASWRAGRLIGVAPLRFTARLLHRDATLLGMGEGGYGLGDYAGLVAAPGTERDVADAVLDWLGRRRGWDVLDLQQLPPGAMTEALVGAVGRRGVRSLVRPHNTCHVIELPSTWAEYRSRLSTGARDWLERKPRKAERELGATMEPVGAEDLAVEYANMRRFQAQRFGDQPLAREERLRTVITEWLRLAHERDWLRMFRLRSDSRTIGVLLGYEYENIFYFHSAAFESLGEGARYSLGASLLAGALRFSIDHGLVRFDMLRGHYEYKARLGSERRYNYRLMVFRGSLRGLAIESGLHIRTMLKGKRPWQKELAAPAAGGGADAGSESAARAPENLAGASVRVE